MGAMASQITSLAIVYSTVYSGADQRKHQSAASLAFVWGIHRGPVNSPHKWPVTRKMFPFDDVIMQVGIEMSNYNLYVGITNYPCPTINAGLCNHSAYMTNQTPLFIRLAYHMDECTISILFLTFEDFADDIVKRICTRKPYFRYHGILCLNCPVNFNVNVNLCH